jgi:hypothetical protein
VRRRRNVDSLFLTQEEKEKAVRERMSSEGRNWWAMYTYNIDQTETVRGHEQVESANQVNLHVMGTLNTGAIGV